MTPAEVEAVRAADEALPRDLVTAGYGEVHEHRRALLAALDEARAELEAAREVVAAARARDGCDETCAMMRDIRGCRCGSEALDEALARYDAVRG